MDVLTIKNENVITTGNIKLFLCDICNDCYSQERSFKLHYRAHKSFPCEICQQVFTLKRDLNTHLRTHNETKQKYICAECDTEFFSKNQVKKHMKCHESKRYICKICNAEFSDATEFKAHKNTHKTYVCEDCNTGFPKKSELKGHACAATVVKFKPSEAAIDYLKHSDDKQEVTDSEAVSKSPSKSRIKEESHTSDTSASAVKQQAKRSTSSPDKPYFCEMCETGFRRNSSLISHKCPIKKKRIT